MSPSWASAGSARCACSSSCTPRRLRVPSTPPLACQPAHCAAATLHTRPQLRRLPCLTHLHSLLRVYAVRRSLNLVSNHTRRGAREEDAVSLERDRRHLRQRQPERPTSRRACSATSSRARRPRHRILRLHPDRHSRAVARRCCRTTAARPCTRASAEGLFKLLYTLNIRSFPQHSAPIQFDPSSPSTRSIFAGIFIFIFAHGGSRLRGDIKLYS